MSLPLPSPTEVTYTDKTGWPAAFFRAACIGSAGVVSLAPGYGLYFPHVGTSTLVHDERGTPRATAASEAISAAAPAAPVRRGVLALSPADQVTEALSALAVNKSQLAEILQVSRPTLYDWSEGKEPNNANAARLTALLRILEQGGASSRSPLFRRFVIHALTENGMALIDALRSEAWDERRVSALVCAAKALGDEAESRRISKEDKLRALGFEEPSDEQRREQLARNVAMGEWPKT